MRQLDLHAASSGPSLDLVRKISLKPTLSATKIRIISEGKPAEIRDNRISDHYC